MIETLKEFIQTVDRKKRLLDVNTHQDLIVKLTEVSRGLGKRFYNRSHVLIEILKNHILSIDHELKIGYLRTLIEGFYLNVSLLRKVQHEYAQQREAQLTGAIEERSENSSSEEAEISEEVSYEPNKSKGIIVKTFQLIFKVMMSIAEDIPNIWSHPPNDFDENDFDNLKVDDQDSYLVYSLRFLVNDLSIILENHLFMNLIRDIILPHENDSWKERFSKIMCIPISKDMQVDEVREVMELLRICINNPHEKVRFAVAQILIELGSSVSNEIFHVQYFNEVMETILNGLNDISERVRSHWLICLNEFYDGEFDKSKIFEYSNKIINRLYELIESESVFTKKHALIALATISSIPLIYDETTIQRPIELFDKFVENYPVALNQKFVGLVFEFASYIISKQTNSLVEKYIDDFFNKFSIYCSKINPSSAMRSWLNMIKKSQFDETCKEIFTKIIAMPYENIEILYIRTIQVTAETFPEEFEEYFEDAVENINQIFDQNVAHHQQEIVSLSLIALMTIHQLVKPEYEESDWKDGVKEFIKESVIPKMNSITKSEYYSSFNKIIGGLQTFVESCFEILNESHRKELVEFLIKLFQEIQIYDKERKRDVMFLREQQKEVYEIQIYIDESMSSSEESKHIKNKFYYSNLNEYDLIERIAILRESKKILSLFLIDCIEKLQNPKPYIKTIYEKAASYHMDSEDIEMAVNLVNRILEKFNFLTPKEITSGAADELQIHSSVQEVYIRKDILRNIEIAIEKIPKECAENKLIERWINCLKEACLAPNIEYSQSDLDHCISYSAVIMGKLIIKYNNEFDLKNAYKDWFEMLPLKFLDNERVIQMEVLCKAFSKEQNLIFGEGNSENVEKLEKIMKIFGNFNKVDATNQEQIKFGFLCEKVLMAVTNEPLFKENKEKIEENLSEEQMKIIKYFVEFTKSIDTSSAE